MCRGAEVAALSVAERRNVKKGVASLRTSEAGSAL